MVGLVSGSRAMTHLATATLALYPQAWRARYEQEMRALLAERGTGPRAVLDLLRGAADAHLHPQNNPPPASTDQMRGTAGAAVAAWVAFVVCGAAFAKLTEDEPFRAAGAVHPLMGGARIALTVLALLSAAVVPLGGARLIFAVLRRAHARREPRLLGAIGMMPVAIAAFAAATAVLAWMVNAGHVRAHSALSWGVFLAWVAIGLSSAAACAATPRTALRLVEPPADALRWGVHGALALSAVLALMTLATVLYAVAIELYAPSLASAPNGPLGILSTTASLAILVVTMAALAALSATTSVRGLRALRAAG